MSRYLPILLIAVVVVVSGCSKKAMERFKKATGDAKAVLGEDDVEISDDPFAPSEEDGPEGVKYLQAVKPFYVAIGMMPETVPVELRKAAIRGEIRCRFTPEALKETMENYEMTAEELEKDDNDIYPYFKVKTVLLEENGALKIGYFECVPPSMLD